MRIAESEGDGWRIQALTTRNRNVKRSFSRLGFHCGSEDKYPSRTPLIHQCLMSLDCKEGTRWDVDISHQWGKRPHRGRQTSDVVRTPRRTTQDRRLSRSTSTGSRRNTSSKPPREVTYRNTFPIWITHGLAIDGVCISQQTVATPKNVKWTFY